MLQLARRACSPTAASTRGTSLTKASLIGVLLKVTHSSAQQQSQDFLCKSAASATALAAQVLLHNSCNCTLSWKLATKMLEPDRKGLRLVGNGSAWEGAS